VCPSLERWQAPLETALGTLGVPYALEAYAPFDRTPYGQALLSLLRFAWLGGGRGDLYAFLRSPYSSFTRQNVDFLEGRLRGRAVDSPERVEEETIRLRDGQPLAVLEALRSAPSPLDGVAGLAAFMLRAAYGLEAPPVGELSRQDIRAHEAVMRLVEELRGWSELEGSLSTEEVFSAVERADVRRSSTSEAGRIAVREAATDEGSPREPSPFWDEVQALFPKEDVARWTRRRPLSALTWPLEEAPTDRERLRAVAIRAADDSVTADAIATANGWDRRLGRALRAFDRP